MKANPYCSDGGEPRLRKSVFVLMDILGYSEMVDGCSSSLSDQQALLLRIHGSLKRGRDWLEETFIGEELRKFLGWEFALKAFTDNIILSWPVAHDAEMELAAAFNKLSAFQLKMIEGGFFVRGAISVGNAYVDEIAVFGDALVEAYKGESMYARDPRIILTPSARESIGGHLSHYGGAKDSPYFRHLLLDSDGQWFLNYLTVVLVAEERGPFYEQLELHKEAVESNLRRYAGVPRIWAKYAWVAAYHNYFCDLYPAYFSDGFKIDLELFRARPSRIGGSE